MFAPCPISETKLRQRNILADMTAKGGSRRNLCPELPGPRGKRRQPLDLQISARAEQIDPRRREYGEVNLVAAPIGTTAIVVGKSVIARKLPGAEKHSRAVLHLRVRPQRADPPSPPQRRFRPEEVPVFPPPP